MINYFPESSPINENKETVINNVYLDFISDAAIDKETVSDKENIGRVINTEAIYTEDDNIILGL